MIDLHAQKTPLFGLYVPANLRRRPTRRAGRSVGSRPGPAAAEDARRAREGCARLRKSDFVFNGNMEGGVDRGIGPFTDCVNALMEEATPAVALAASAVGEDAEDRGRSRKADRSREGDRQHQPAAQPRRQHDRVRRRRERRRSEDRASRRCASSRRAARAPTTSASRRTAWGLSRQRLSRARRTSLAAQSDDGELTNWTIVESKDGLAQVREIAAVKGSASLFPGAGTLRGVFTTTDAEGKRNFDADGWETAIQQVPVGVQGVQRAVRLSGDRGRHRDAGSSRASASSS